LVTMLNILDIFSYHSPYLWLFNNIHHLVAIYWLMWQMTKKQSIALVTSCSIL